MPGRERGYVSEVSVGALGGRCCPNEEEDGEGEGVRGGGAGEEFGAGFVLLWWLRGLREEEVV